jgi:hypothetical protein
VQPAVRLDIVQTAQDIHLVYDIDRQTRTLTPGEKSSITFMDDRGSAEVAPAWKGDKLTVHTTVANRITIDEEYSLAKDGSLVTTEKLSGGRLKTVTITSVYRKMK